MRTMTTLSRQTQPPPPPLAPLAPNGGSNGARDASRLEPLVVRFLIFLFYSTLTQGYFLFLLFLLAGFPDRGLVFFVLFNC